MTGKRFSCLVLVVAVAGLGCANGAPKPSTCAMIGGLVGGGAGAAVGGDRDWHQRAGQAVLGGAVLGVAGHILCRLAQKEEPAPEPTPPPAPPAPPPVVEEEAVVVVEEAVAEKIVLRGVNFDFDKAEIRPDAAIILDEVVSILSGRPQVQVRVEGHTDATGPEAYNQGLSERRAASVLEYLADHGIDPSRLSSVGYGESNPIAGNDTREGRALNRRVELQVLD